MPHFNELFTVEDRTIKPRVPIQIGDLLFGTDSTFDIDDSVGLLKIRALVNKNLYVEIEEGVYRIIGFSD